MTLESIPEAEDAEVLISSPMSMGACSLLADSGERGPSFSSPVDVRGKNFQSPCTASPPAGQKGNTSKGKKSSCSRAKGPRVAQSVRAGRVDKELSNPEVGLDPLRLIIIIHACDIFTSWQNWFRPFHNAESSRLSHRLVQRDNHVPLWPVPPPRWRWSGSDHLGPRRRKRRRKLELRHRLLQLIVCALNWETLCHPVRPPVHACIGSHITPAQHDILERLERLIIHYSSMTGFSSGDLGRSAEKFQDLIRCIQELPQQQEPGLEDLEQISMAILSDFDPYSSHFARKDCRSEAAVDPPLSHCGTDTDVRVELPLTSSRPVVSDRVKWEYAPSFDAAPFLSNPLIRSAYLDPEVLRKLIEQWEHFPPGKVFCTKEELLKLTQRSDGMTSGPAARSQPRRKIWMRRWVCSACQRTKILTG